MMTWPDIEIFVLAGGKSSRMKCDKGLMLFEGKPMVTHILDTLACNGLSATLIANREEYARLGLNVYKDLINDKGPMGGLFTALHHTAARAVLLLSSDMPFLNVDAVKFLAKNCGSEQVTVAQSHQRLHPLLAVYKKTLLTSVKKQIEDNKLKLTDFILTCNYKICNMDSFTVYNNRMFDNLNTPLDLEKHYASKQ